MGFSSLSTGFGIGRHAVTSALIGVSPSGSAFVGLGLCLCNQNISPAYEIRLAYLLVDRKDLHRESQESMWSGDWHSSDGCK